jgi:hypothetical protein
MCILLHIKLHHYAGVVKGKHTITKRIAIKLSEELSIPEFVTIDPEQNHPGMGTGKQKGGIRNCRAPSSPKEKIWIKNLSFGKNRVH